MSHNLRVDYYLNPVEVAEYNGRKMKELDRKAENHYITQLQYECQVETRNRNRMIEDAQGWFFPDLEKMRKADNYEMKSCRRLDSFGYHRQY